MTNHLLQITGQAPTFFTWNHTLTIIYTFFALAVVGFFSYTFYRGIKALNNELLVEYSEKKQ